MIFLLLLKIASIIFLLLMKNITNNFFIIDENRKDKTKKTVPIIKLIRLFFFFVSMFWLFCLLAVEQKRKNKLKMQQLIFVLPKYIISLSFCVVKISCIFASAKGLFLT
jgi:membrane-associated HD superfamily phosphohydrolase